ncbi:UPF0606 protein KIAA1549 isoform X4 [Tachysurus ichikawai]
MELTHEFTSPTTLLYPSFEALGQSNDIHRTFSILPNNESPKASKYYYSHTISSVYASALMPPPSLIDGTQLTALNVPSAELDSFAEPPFAPPELQAERISNNDTTYGAQEKLSNHLVPSHDLHIQNDATLDDHQLYPSHAIFGNYYVTSSFIEPTMGPPEVYFPANTMDADYGSGSGDYLETMSYMGSEADDYSLVTNLPSDMYDFEDSNSESYDTSFPTRVMIPLSTKYPSPSPSKTVPDRHVTTNPNMTFSITQNSTSTFHVTSSKMTISQSVTPTLTSIPNSIPIHISFPSTIHVGVQAIHPTAVHSRASADPINIVSETSESYSNWPDVTIEPSDVLLPDMNSLEYYNIQLTKSNESWTEQRGNQTTSKYFSLPLSVSTISTYTVPPSHVVTEIYGEDFQPMDNNSWPEESSTDISGLDLSNTTILDLSDIRPSLINSTFPFLYSSALTPSMDISSSLWDLAKTPDWNNSESVSSAVASSTSPSAFLPPSDSEETDVIFPTSTNTYWSMNSTLPETSLPTTSLNNNVFTQTHNTSAAPTDSTLNSTSALPVTDLADQGFTGSERPFSEVTDDGIVTTINKSGVSTISVLNNETTVTTPGPTTEVFNTTTLTTTPSVTTQPSTLQTTTVREYLCNITKPDTYLVRVVSFTPPLRLCTYLVFPSMHNNSSLPLSHTPSLQLQTPSVKGFDFAKLHLGQHSKDDLRVIQEPLPAPAKDPSANENTEASTPKSKGSSTKASRNSQHRRGQISPSDGDSLGSEPFSERDSPKANTRQTGLSSDPKQPRPPPLSGADDQVSSASIFEHVDRMSRSADGANKRFSNKIQLIAMQPMPALPLPCPTVDTKTADNTKMNKEIQVALRQKSEIEHHRNKIRLRAKRKGHYDFPAMDDLMDSLGDAKEQDRIYQKAQMQIDKILDPDSRVLPLYTEPKKSSREKRSPKQRKKQQMNGDLVDADRDRLITNESDGTYKKYPGVNNVAYVSDPDQGSEAQSPSPTDDVFLSSMSPPGAPPPYLPPQPSIEEARQQMHSLLDDAFALVSPTSQASNAGITLPGLGVRSEHTALSSPPSRGPRPCGPTYPVLSPFSGRYSDLGLSPTTVQGLMHRPGLGCVYSQGEGVGGEQLQSEGLYNSRGGYIDEPPSSARPRPVGGTTGAQLHPMTQVSLSGRVNEGRQPGALNWGPYHEEDFRPVNRDPTPRSGMREPSAPPAHLDSMGLGFSSSAPPEESIPPSHSSASLIKAIREELMRLSQTQAAPAGYHS